jgi:Ser/Thr protein kinase RdoA (MazF antagonist)
VTFWPLAVPVATSDIDPSSFGQVLRRLHSVTDRSAPSAWKPASALRAGLNYVRRKMSGGSVALAAPEVERVLAWIDGPGSALATGVIHGDASPDNAVYLHGNMLLIDFELAGVSPVAYDFSPVRVLARRFDLPAEFAAGTILIR